MPERAPDMPTGDLAVAPVEPEPTIPSQVQEPPSNSVHVLSGPAPVAPHGHIATPQFPVMPPGTLAPPPRNEPDVPESAVLGSVEEADSHVSLAATVHDHAYNEPAADHESPYHTPDVHRGGPSFVHLEPPLPETLISETTDHSVTAAFNALAASRLADNSEELLGIARDMIRPLLKAWIDDNLPSMVERMVRAEIERVARGGR